MSLKQPPNGSNSRPRSVSLSPTDNKKERFKKLGGGGWNGRNHEKELVLGWGEGRDQD